MKTLADVFLEILSQFQDKETKIMANRMKTAIKNREISNVTQRLHRKCFGTKINY